MQLYNEWELIWTGIAMLWQYELLKTIHEKGVHNEALDVWGRKKWKDWFLIKKKQNSGEGLSRFVSALRRAAMAELLHLQG